MPNSKSKAIYKKIKRKVKSIYRSNFVALLSLFSKKEFKIIKLSQLHNRGISADSSKTKISPVKILSPRIVYGDQIAIQEEVSHPQYDTSFKVLDNVTAFGGGNFVITSKDEAIFPDNVDLETDVLMAEIHNTVQLKKNKIRIMRKYIGRKRAKNAIHMICQCGDNYAHFILETLTKLAALNNLNRFQDYSLLVDTRCPEIFLDALKGLDKFKREIILVKPGQFIDIEHLVFSNDLAYTPVMNRRLSIENELPPPANETHLYSANALSLTRSMAHMACGSREKFEDRREHQKLCLIRNRENSFNKRNCTNYSEIINHLSKDGFRTVNPQDFTIFEQIQIFSQCQFLVSETGAALANMLFCPSGCRVIVLAAYFKNADYFYFSNLAQLLGHHISFVVGDIEEIAGQAIDPLNVDYGVSLEAFKKEHQRITGLGALSIHDQEL